jgi:uncharacterized membrane protein
MEYLYITILILTAVIPFLLDWHSTSINQSIPEIKESTKIFRRLDGHTNMPKFLLFNVVALSILIAFGFFMMHFADASFFGFIGLPMFGVYRTAVAMNNYKLHRKYTR